MTTTVAQIRDQLRDAILDGELGPEHTSTQTGLAAHLGVSRTPLREALRMLELEGLVVRESNGRFRIAPISTDDIEELTVMRLSLETMAVRLTVPVFDNADHAELEGLLAQIERFAYKEDWVGIEDPHRAFHQKMISGSGDRTIELLGRYWDHAARYRKMSFRLVANSPTNWKLRSAEHRAMLDAFEAYDADAAASWLARQIARTAIEATNRIDPKYPASRVRETLKRQTGSEMLED